MNRIAVSKARSRLIAAAVAWLASVGTVAAEPAAYLGNPEPGSQAGFEKQHPVYLPISDGVSSSRNAPNVMAPEASGSDRAPDSRSQVGRESQK